MTTVALIGHSLGGLTAWRVLQQDSRWKAGILLDPALSADSPGTTTTPVMLLTMGREHWSDGECGLWNDLHGPRVSVNFRGSEHLTPSDAVWLAQGTIKTGTMGPAKTIAAARDYVAAFLDQNLRGRPEDRLLGGPSLDYPDAVVASQRQSLCTKAEETVP